MTGIGAPCAPRDSDGHSELEMHTGIDFLDEQLDDAIGQHTALLRSLSDHAADADDDRFRDLCARFLPRMRDHQQMLEQFRASRRPGPPPTDTVVSVFNRAFVTPRALVDAPRSDYQELITDIAMVRQLEVTFKIFRDAGRHLGIPELAKVGEVAERHHDDYSDDARRLLYQMFVERAHDAADAVNVPRNSRAEFRG
jgi:hypothetical protein